jgi:hypothetical protein
VCIGCAVGFLSCFALTPSAGLVTVRCIEACLPTHLRGAKDRAFGQHLIGISYSESTVVTKEFKKDSSGAQQAIVKTTL